MISIDLIAKGFDFVTDKGLDWFKAIVQEVDKHRLIDYGEQRVANKNRQKLNHLLGGGLAVKRQAEQQGVDPDHVYRRS